VFWSCCVWPLICTTITAASALPVHPYCQLCTQTPS
jgi:hypothetical protein